MASLRPQVRCFLNLLTLLALLAPLASPWALPQPAPASAAPLPEERGAPPTAAPFDAWTDLFRAWVTLPNTTSRARLDTLGVVVLEETETHALILADGEQLETLARLRFQPQASEDLGMLAEYHAQAKPWLAESLQPLLAQAGEVRALSLAADGSTPAATPSLQQSKMDLQAALQGLTTEQQAGIMSLTNIDSDGDGLTDTQEAWWCTDSMNVDSDGDGASDADEVQAAKDWLNNLRAGPPATGKPFAGWPPQIPGCRDDDQDSVPDLAERWELGLNMNRESTDRDKFDDGQELFGNTYCPGSGGFCGYGALPRNEDWGVIFAEMPSWVKAPGNHPLIAAFPVPEIDVVPSSLHVETVTTVTTDHTISSGTERSYSTAKTEGESTSLATSVTWNDWEEISQTSMGDFPSFSANGSISRIATGSTKSSIIQTTNSIIETLCPPGLVLSPVGNPYLDTAIQLYEGACNAQTIGQGIGEIINGTAYYASLYGPKLTGAINAGLDKFQQVIKKNSKSFGDSLQKTYQAVKRTANNAVESLANQNRQSGCSGTQVEVNNSMVSITPYYQVSFPMQMPTETQTRGHSIGGSNTTTHTEYEEHTITNGEAFSSGESWGTATAVDSAHAADLWFTYVVSNTGTEYAREIGDLAFNIYIGDDPNPAYTYFVGPDLGGDGKFHNLMPGEEHIYTSRRIPLTLVQMKSIEVDPACSMLRATGQMPPYDPNNPSTHCPGSEVRIVVEDFTYGIDELFYQDAVNAGVLIALEDGMDDGDEAIDTYLIPTWGEETVMDVLARYFPHTLDAYGNLIAIWTPEYRADTPAWCNEPRVVGSGSRRAVWCKKALSTADWWNIYTNGMGDGGEGFQDTLAAPGSMALFRFNQDSDLDGYSDRSELRLGTDPNNAASYPRPELLAGVHSIRVGNYVTATLSLLNTGVYDAYGVEAIMIAPNDTISITNNTVGGSGRVRAQREVVVGSRILLQTPLPTPWMQSGHAQPAIGGYYTGQQDRTYTFTVQCGNPAGCDVSAGAWTLSWNDSAGANGTLNFGAGYASPTLLNVGTQGLKLGLLTGKVFNGEAFTIETRTPRDTFQYVINTEPFTPPVVVVSYNDPQGNHRFIIPPAAMALSSPTADLIPFAGQMLQDPGVEIATTEPFTSGINITNLVVNNPTGVTLTNAHLFLDFVNISGTVASEVPVTVTLPAGPSVVPVTWDTSTFSPTFQVDKDYIVMAFWTDWQGNILDTAGRPLSSFQADPRPNLAMSTDTIWDFGEAVQGTVLKHAFDLANTGYLDLLTYVNAPAGVTLSQQGSRSIGPADVTTYEITLDTINMPLGAYDQTITIRSSDPVLPVRTVRVLGTVTAASCDGFLGEYFSNQTLSGVPALTRCDDLLDFNWGDGSPDPAIPVNQFSARWTKRITAHSASNYRFDVRSDDGVRVYVDNQLVVNSWIDQGFLFASGSKPLTAGEHDLRVEWYENAGGAAIRLVYGPEGTRMYPLDWPVTLASGTQGQWIQYTHTLGPDTQTLHPVKVYSQNYGTLWGVGKYATPFGSGTTSYDMFGDGRDGVMPTSGNLDNNNGFGAGIVNSGSLGSTSISVTDAHGVWRINPGDVVLIHQTQGTGAGCWELNKAVSDFGGGTATYQLAQPLQCNFVTGGSNRAQIIRIPQYSTCNITGTVYPLAAWNGSWGGIFAVLCNNPLTIASGGRIDANAAGFRGGQAGNDDNSTQGEGYPGLGTYRTEPNGNGGGAGHANTGGGGGYGTGGTPGYDHGSVRGYGGLPVGAADLSTLYFGGGGGGGASNGCGSSRGGAGGGAILVYAPVVYNYGNVQSNGETAPNACERPGGGGAGGAIRLFTRDAILGANTITAIGGSGGLGGSGCSSCFGGNGGVGRIHVGAQTRSGSTNPAYNFQQLAFYIAEQVETSPYTSGRLNLPETFTGGRTYQVQYGRRHVFTAAGYPTSTLRLPSGAFTDVRLDALISEVGTGNRAFSLDIGNDGTWDWEWSGSVTNAVTLNSPNLSAAFSRYWATHGAPTSGTLDVPVKVYLSQAGQVLLTNLRVTPTGSKVRYARLPAQTYSSMALNLSVGTSGSGPLTVAADVGNNGSVDWTYTATSATYPLALTTGNLATAFNAYLAGHTGEVAVPVRFYVTPFVDLGLRNYTTTVSAQSDLSLTAADTTFGVTNPTEGDAVPITVTLHNNGALAATGHTVAFYATAPEWGEWYIGSAFVPGIPAGGTAEASISWDTLGFTGATPVRVVADPYNRLAETNETNNQATASLTILTRSDLEPTFAAFSNPEPVAGETITVSLQVANLGQVAASAFTVGLYHGNPNDGGEMLQTANLSVPGGGNVTATFSWTPAAPGPYRLFALVDKEHAVNESNRGNNLTWQDIYIGVAGPLLLNSGGPTDPAYSAALGYGFIDEGPADVTGSCGPAPHESYRLDYNPAGGRVVYRFDHLLPGHFYHLDVTLYKCGFAGRQETIRVNGQLVAGPIDLGDGQVHRLSLLLDPALYTGRTIRVDIEAEGGESALVNEVNLYDVDYRYADAGGPNDPQYPGGLFANLGRPYGWLNGVQNIAWGALPYKSIRVNPLGNLLEYRFDGLDPAKRYNIHLVFWQPSGTARIQRVRLDGLDSGLTVNTGDYQVHRETLAVPASAYAADGSLTVSIVRMNETTGAMVNEIGLEEETLPRTSWCSAPQTPYFTDVYGDVAILGQGAAAGTVIEARNPRGDTVGCFVVGVTGQYGFMRIYGEDTTAIPAIPGMRAGELAAFRVNGAPAVATPQLYWQADYTTHRIDLNAGSITGQSILLQAGWNLMSFRLEPPVPTVRQVLDSIDGRYDRVLGEDGAYVPILPPEFNTLKELHPGRGYYIRITGSTAATALIEGSPIPAATPIPLHEGWNWIGYLPEVTLPITVALQSIAGQYQRVLSLDKTYDPAFPGFSTLHFMEPGKGYLIYMNQEATLIYPEASTLLTEIPQKATPAICGSLNPTPKFTQLYGELWLGDRPAPAGSRIEVLTPRGEIAGCFVLEKPGVVNFMHVYGEDTTTEPPIVGFRDGEPVTFRVNGVAVENAELLWHDDWASHAVTLRVNTLQIYLPFVIRDR